jgi:hypothetical protein
MSSLPPCALALWLVHFYFLCGYGLISMVVLLLTFDCILFFGTFGMMALDLKLLLQEFVPIKACAPSPDLEGFLLFFWELKTCFGLEA